MMMTFISDTRVIPVILKMILVVFLTLVMGYAAITCPLNDLLETLILGITAFIVFWYTEETSLKRAEMQQQTLILRQQAQVQEEEAKKQTHILTTQLEDQKREFEERSKPFLVWGGKNGSAGLKLENQGATVSPVRFAVEGREEKSQPVLRTGEPATITAPADLGHQFRFQVKYRDKVGTPWVDTYRFDPQPSIGITREKSSKGTD